MSQKPLYLSNNFIEWGIENDVPITQLHLQKLLYLYYARYCYLLDLKPFDDCFVKWPYGPVLTSVYEQAKKHGRDPLPYLQDMNDQNYKMALSKEEARNIFEDVVRRYGRKSASDLVKLTHEGPDGVEYKTAWDKTQQMGSFLAAADIKEDGRVFFEGD